MKNPEQLTKLRSGYECGLFELTVINEGNAFDTILVVLEKTGKSRSSSLASLASAAKMAYRFHCHRYFTIGDQWMCSVDGQGVTMEAVWAWLREPTAMAVARIMRPEEAES